MRRLPNLLTIGRILLTPFIGWAIARNDWSGCFPLIFVAGVSDALDGYLARRFGWLSALGAWLDPLADKFLLATVYLGFGFGATLPWWLVGLVLGRDLLILAFAGAALRFTRARRFPPSEWGKLSTFCQLSLAGFTVMGGAWPAMAPRLLVAFCVSTVAVTTVWSGVEYLRAGWRMVRRAESGD